MAVPKNIQVVPVISDTLILRALHFPGKPLFRWRDNFAKDVHRIAKHHAPVGHEINALHRGGITGTYKAGLTWNRRGSRGHVSVARIEANAPHSRYVENGRNPSYEPQFFSWSGYARMYAGKKAFPPGDPAGPYWTGSRRSTIPGWGWDQYTRKWKRPNRWARGLDMTGMRRGTHNLERAFSTVVLERGIGAKVTPVAR